MTEEELEKLKQEYLDAAGFAARASICAQVSHSPAAQADLSGAFEYSLAAFSKWAYALREFRQQ